MNLKPIELDLLIKNAKIVTMDDDKTVIENGVLGISNGQIVILEEHIPGKVYQTREVLDARNRVIFPGLINTHSHFFQIMLKGMGADLPLLDWAMEVPVPFGPKITPEIDYYAAKLAVLESLRSGCTTVTDFMYAHAYNNVGDAVIKAMSEGGIRGVFIRNFHDCGKEFGLPDSFIEPYEKVFSDVERLKREYADKSDDLIRVWTGPSVTWGISNEGLKRTVEFSNSNGIPYSTHINETDSDNDSTLNRYGKKTIDLMEETGFLSPRLLAVHCVKMSPDEIRRMAKYDVKISYNAVSNMYLGSGVAPIVEFLKAGATISLGTDGAASNNSMDMIETLKISALLQKVKHENPGIISANDVVRMATIDGAKSLHWDEKIGSLEIGKQADLFIFNPNDPKSVPMHDPVATLVYSSSINNVETTIVNGKILFHQGEFKNGIDEEKFISEFKDNVNKFIKKSN